MKRFFYLLSHPLLWLALLCFFWEMAAQRIPKVDFFFASPSSIAISLRGLVVEENLWRHVLVTAGEALTGLVLGTLLGTLVGLVLWYLGRFATIARLLITIIGSFPVFAIAPLMIIWFGVGFGMKAAMATIATLFVAISQAFRGANSVSGDYLELLKGMNAKREQVLLKLIVPGSLNAVLGGMRINVGLSLLGAFIGEFISSDEGLGYLILRASSLYNMPRAFAGAICIVAVALAFDGLASLLEKNREWILQRVGVPKPLWGSYNTETRDSNFGKEMMAARERDIDDSNGA